MLQTKKDLVSNMRLLFQFLIIVVISFVGEMLNHFIPLPIPASIYGIVILFTALKMQWIKPHHIGDVCRFLILIMPVLFIPSAVGLIKSWDLISANLLQYVVILMVSTVVVMAASAIATQQVIKRSKRKQQ